MDDKTLTILNDFFKKEGSNCEIEGLTILIDGPIKQVFDIIKAKREYESYNEVLRDIIFEGVNNIIKQIK